MDNKIGEKKLVSKSDLYLSKLVIDILPLNQFYKNHSKEIDNSYLITQEDIKLFKIIFTYFSHSQKYRDIQILWKSHLKYNNKNVDFNKIKDKICIPHKLIVKFFNFCIMNISVISEYINFTKDYINMNIYNLIKKLFLKNIITLDDFNAFLTLKLILCLYNDNYNIIDNKDKNINNNLNNLHEFYLLIDFILSFINENMNNENKIIFNKAIECLIKNIQNIIIKDNFNNAFILSRDHNLFKLIELSKISNDITNIIIPLLINIYKNKFNIDFIFNDLSEQFILNSYENTLNKTNYLISKNIFLNMLFPQEEKQNDDISINSGFIFNDHPDNGIICSLPPLNYKKFPKDGFSIVVSFCPMVNKTSRRYNIFSFYSKEKDIFMSTYIQNSFLKFSYGWKEYDLFSGIKINKNYTFWVIFSKDKNGAVLFYLNGHKKDFTFIKYPTFEYEEIYIGCNRDNDQSMDNFEGLIGTFIFFNKNLIKDKNDNQNENKLIELKGDYEMVIDIINKKNYIFVNRNTSLILNKYLLDKNDISQYIEIIISVKSLGNFENNNNYILNNDNLSFVCNYFNYNSLEDESNCFFYKFNTKEVILNNISYPIEYKNSFLQFLNNHGIMYLQLELYYLMGVLSSTLNKNTLTNTNNTNNKNEYILNEKDIQEMNLNLTQILSLFFYCINSKIYVKELNQNEINNFFYTFNDIISIYTKYGFKIRSLLLSLFNIQKLLINNLLVNKCEFLFIYDNYDTNDKKVFTLLFQNLISIIDGYELFSDKSNIIYIFQKMLNFDKIYFDENINKETKKRYSELIQKFICISLKKNDNIFFDIYLNRLKQIKEELTVSLFSLDEKSNNSSLYYNFEDNITTTVDFESDAESENSYRNSRNNSLDINTHKPISLKLMYKYLKNLFISIGEPNIYKNFLNIFSQNIEKVNLFFNDLFSYLMKEYNIINKGNKINKEIKISELKYSELIKSLCIQFLDEIFLEKNIKEINEQKSNKSSKKLFNKSQLRLGSFITTLPNLTKGSFIGYSRNNTVNELNLIKNNSVIEGLNENQNFSNSFNNTDIFKQEQKNIFYIIKNFEFFNNFILSPYTFSSFYLLLFRKKIDNKQKIKMIKNYNSKLNPSDLALPEKNNLIEYITDILLLLIEKIGNDINDCDTVFMNKYKLLDFCFNCFNGFLKNVLNLYSNKDSTKNDEEILNYLFTYKDNCFYEIIYNNFNYFISALNCESNDDNEIKENEEFLEKFFNKIKEELKIIIDKTLFNIKDPFYFTLLNKIFFSNNNNNKNNDFVLEIISYLINKYVSLQTEENDNINKLFIIEINNKNLLILIYKIFFYIPKRRIIINNEKFLKIIYMYLSTFLSFNKLLYLKILFPIEEINENVNSGRNNMTNINKKLIIEILYELILEIYLEYVRDTKKIYLQIFEDLFYDLLNIKNLANHKFNKSIMENFEVPIEDKKINHTFFYVLDKISFNNKNIFKIADGVKIKTENLKKLKELLCNTYKNEYNEKENIYSVCIIFIIKILITIRSINELLEKLDSNCFKNINLQSKDTSIENNIKVEIFRDNENNIHIKNVLISVFNQLCQDTLKIYKKYNHLNPFSSEGKYNNNLYTYFKNFIVKNYNNDRYYDFNNLIKKLSEHMRFLKNFSRVIYNSDGSIILYTYKNYMIMSKVPIKTESSLPNTKEINTSNINPESTDADTNTNNDKGKKTETSNKKKLFRNNSFDSNNPKMKSTRSDNKSCSNLAIQRMKRNSQNELFLSYTISNISKKFLEINKTKSIKDNNNIDEQKNNYVKKIRLKSDIIRKYFNSFFQKLLTYDKDFLIIKKIYKYFYNKEIPNIDEYNNFNCPLKLNNYISPNHYIKLFLTKDFNFYNSKYFQYSHKYLFKQNKKNIKKNMKYLKESFIKQTSVLFPAKELFEKNDFPNNDLLNEKLNRNIKKYYCELLLSRGSIFGKLFFLENGILFLSNWENDKRNKGKAFEYACCSLEYDYLKENKKIFILYEEINEVINRYFCFTWISQEIFVKDGKSYFFNFFNEKHNEEIFEIFKSKKISNVIKNPKEYFEKEEFTKKWKEGIINTYDYLLILNKLSSRSYNDLNQYPLMPWIHLTDNSIRNFDLPISLQDENNKQIYKKKIDDYKGKKSDVYHSNHYSTAAYIYFYLMRINPFSNNMIKFQSNNFDVPDRQFRSIKWTIELCEKYNNNRELIPEIFEIPEIYYNINYNDFGIPKENMRIHNIVLEPYAKNGIEYCYTLKNKINYDLNLNSNITQWFDFIFGVNQWSDNPKDNAFRLFSEKSYAQNVNIKKSILEYKKQKLNDNTIFEKIKDIILYSVNFGQCPSQILSELHPKKNNIHENREVYQDNSIDEIITIKNKNNSELSYFYKNKINKNIICLLKNGSLTIYNPKKKNNNEYELLNGIKINGLLNQDTISKFSFCELKEGLYIFCGYSDKSLKIVYNKIKFNYILDTFITSIIGINDKECVSGHNDGKLIKWEVKIKNTNNQINYQLIKILSIKSNINSITALEYNEKLNILLSGDNKSIIIRNYYNFEFLSFIDLNQFNNQLNTITSIKISNCNLIYALIKTNEENLYELYCYTLNGTFSCKMKGNFTDFELTDNGNVIIGDLDNGIIKILRGYDLFKIYSKPLSFYKVNKNNFNMIYESPNILYISSEEGNCAKIKKIIINRNDEKYFI